MWTSEVRSLLQLQRLNKTHVTLFIIVKRILMLQCYDWSYFVGKSMQHRITFLVLNLIFSPQNVRSIREKIFNEISVDTAGNKDLILSSYQFNDFVVPSCIPYMQGKHRHPQAQIGGAVCVVD